MGDVFVVSTDEVGVDSAEVVEEECDFQVLLVAQLASSVSGTMESASQVFVNPQVVLLFDILTVLPGIEFEWSMTEEAFIERLNSMLSWGDMKSRLSSL